MTTGEKIQQLRKAKGLTQENLAAQITVSRQAVSRWELDEVLPDTENLLQLSKIFGVSIDYLLDCSVQSEEELPLAQTIKKREVKRNKLIWLFLALYLLGILVLLLVSRSLVLAYAALSILLCIYLLYLVINLLWKWLRK